MQTYFFETRFSAAHFYHQTSWSFDQNQNTFGKCFSEFGHGHDYRLWIEFKSDDFQHAQKVIQAVTDKIDHQHLNFMINEFKAKIPTTENIAIYLKEEILKSCEKEKAEVQIKKLRLFENPEIWVELNP